MRHQQKSARKMQTQLSHLVFACLLVLNCGVVNGIEQEKLLSSLGAKVSNDLKDLDVSASDNAPSTEPNGITYRCTGASLTSFPPAFLLTRDYGYGGISGVGNSYGSKAGGAYSSVGGYPGLGSGSIYGTGTTYRSAGLIPSYRSYQAGGYGGNGIIGGGHTGYGYYGGTGGYGSGYGGYGGQNTYGGIGSGLYDDDYSGYGGTRVGYGSSGGYGGYRGSYGGIRGAGYNPYEYRGSGGYGGSNYKRYGTHDYQPSGYRGYS